MKPEELDKLRAATEATLAEELFARDPALKSVVKLTCILYGGEKSRRDSMEKVVRRLMVLSYAIGRCTALENRLPQETAH